MEVQKQQKISRKEIVKYGGLALFGVVVFVAIVISTGPGAKYFLGSLISFGPGTVTPTDPSHFAYAENLGWIDFNPTGGSVAVLDGGLTGYAWSENAGWIHLDYDGVAGATNTTSTNWGVVNDGSGNLSGYAYGENIGWVKFDPMFGGSPYGVAIDASGNFSGYAWSENAGWISFNCSNTSSCAPGGYDYKVSTTWRYPYEQGENDTATIIINTQPSGTGSVDDVLTNQPAILLQDSHGTNMADGTAVVASLASGTGALEGTKTATTTDGVATFTNLGYSKAGEAFTILFTVPGSSADTVTSSSVGPLTVGVVSSIVITPADSEITIHQGQTYTVEGFDQYTNSLGDVTSSTTFTVNDSTFGWSGATYRNATAGDYTITGTIGSVTGTASLRTIFEAAGGGGSFTPATTPSNTTPPPATPSDITPSVATPPTTPSDTTPPTTEQPSQINTPSTDIIDYVSQQLEKIKISMLSGTTQLNQPTTNPPSNLQPNQPPSSQAPNTTTNNKGAIIQVLQKILKVLEDLLGLTSK